jgi:hypothetical protein
MQHECFLAVCFNGGKGEAEVVLILSGIVVYLLLWEMVSALFRGRFAVENIHLAVSIYSQFPLQVVAFESFFWQKRSNFIR